MNLGLDFISCELDEEFHKKAVLRIKRATGNVGFFA